MNDPLTINIPPKIRLTMYIFVVLGTSIVVPLDLAHVIPSIVLSVWSSFSGAVSLLAAVNVSSK